MADFEWDEFPGASRINLLQNVGPQSPPRDDAPGISSKGQAAQLLAQLREATGDDSDEVSSVESVSLHSELGQLPKATSKAQAAEPEPEYQRPSLLMEKAAIYLPVNVFAEQDKAAQVQTREAGFSSVPSIPRGPAVPLPGDKRVQEDEAQYGYGRARRGSDEDYDTDAPIIQTLVEEIEPNPGNYVAPNQARAQQGNQAPVMKQPRPVSVKYDSSKVALRQARSFLCSCLMLPLVFISDRHRRKVLTYFLIMLAANIMAFLGIVVWSPQPTTWLTVVLVLPSIMALVRLMAGALNKIIGTKVNLQERIFGHVVMAMMCTNQTLDALRSTLDSIASSNINTLTGTIVAVCDLPPEGQEKRNCALSLLTLIQLEATQHEKDQTIYVGKYCQWKIVIVAKHDRCGLRDSQLRLFNLVTRGALGKVDYIFMTLAETFFARNGVFSLCWRLYAEDDVYAALADIHHVTQSGWSALLRRFEHFMWDFHTRIADSFFATMNNMPSTCVCITADALTPKFIHVFSADLKNGSAITPSGSADDDLYRNIASIAMEVLPARRAVFEPQARVYMSVADSEACLARLDLRWTVAAQQRLVDNIFLPHAFFWTRVNSLYEALATFFQLLYVMVGVFTIVRVVLFRSAMDIGALSAGGALPVIVALHALVYGRLKVAMSVVVFLLVSPCYYALLPVYMAATLPAKIARHAQPASLQAVVV